MPWGQTVAAELGSLGTPCWRDVSDVSSGHESWCKTRWLQPGLHPGRQLFQRCTTSGRIKQSK